MRIRRTIALVAGALLFGGAAGLSAQEPGIAVEPADSAIQGYVPEAPPELPPTAAPAPGDAPAPSAAPVANPTPAVGAELGFLDVLPARSEDRIRDQLDEAGELEREALAELSAAQAEKDRTKGLIAAKKQEISSLDSRRKLAEKNKQEGEKVALEAEKKDAERHKAFLERRASLHDAEIERAKAAQKLAQATTRALQMEQELASRRGDRQRGAAVGAASTRRQDAVIVELEGRTLEVKREQAEAAKKVADKDVDIARRRLELHKAQVAAGGGR